MIRQPVRATAMLLMSLIASASACSRPQPPSGPSADLIVTDAKIWTGDPDRTGAAALAVVGDRIVAVGSSDEVNLWRGAATRVIDAGGRRVVPGFNDAHVHFVDGGLQLDSVALKDAGSPEEFARRIADRARKLAPGEWVLGGEWDDQRWTPARLPAKEWIDATTPSTPVFVSRYDMHMAVANTAAMKLAGVSKATSDPPGGTIVRDAQGNPTGVFKDAAMALVSRAIPPMTAGRRMTAIRRALEHAASLGVTSVQHMSASREDVAAYAELASSGALTTRIYAAPAATAWADQAKLGLGRAFGSSWLRIGAVKGFADGSLGSTTAYFFDPYLDSPGNRGLLSDEMQPLDGMRARLVGADRAGLQLCMHAIGDAAISTMLDVFGDVVGANGERDRRLRIEHAQHMATKDFDRFSAMHVIASVQPYHAIDDGRWAERRIGAERAKTTYAFRTFLDHHVRLALGTDWNVAPLDPMQTLYAAVTRATLDGGNPDGWVGEQKLTVGEALAAYTSGSAFAEFQDGEKGTLARGKLADFVVLSGDVFAVPAASIKDVKVVTTVAGGRVVFQR